MDHYKEILAPLAYMAEECLLLFFELRMYRLYVYSPNREDFVAIEALQVSMSCISYLISIPTVWILLSSECIVTILT